MANFIQRPKKVYNQQQPLSLLNFENGFVDEGSAGYTWSTDLPGTVATTTDRAKFGSQSLFINDTAVNNGYIGVDGGLFLPSTPWTMQFWVNVTGVVASGYDHYLCQWGTGADGRTDGFAITVPNPGSGPDSIILRTAYAYSGSSIYTLAEVGFNLNAWNHVVLQFDGVSLRMAVNGYAKPGEQLVADRFNATQQFRMGWSNGSWDRAVPYYVDNFSVVDGVLYPEAFTVTELTQIYTPPVEPFNGTRLLDTTNTKTNNIIRSKPYDPHQDNVSLLLPFEGANGDTTTSDLSSLQGPVTLYNSAQLSTSQFKNGSSSLYLPSVSSYIQAGTSDAINFGTGEFTLEFWMKMGNQSDNYPHLMSTNVYNATSGWYMLVGAGSFTPAGSVIWAISSNVANRPVDTGLASTSNVLDDQWHHVAIVRNNTDATIKMYVDGILEDTITDVPTSLNLAGGALKAGTAYIDTNDGVTGYIDDLRITKGVARYTTNFSTPISLLSLLDPYAKTNVVVKPKNVQEPLISVTDGLQLFLDAASSDSYPGTGAVWYDLSGKNNHVTLQNSPAYTPNEYFTFTGTEYGVVNNNIESAFDTGEVTVISFARISSIESKATAVSFSDGAENFFFPCDRNGGVKLNYWDNNWSFGNKDYVVGNWYSFAWTNSGSAVSFYYNDAVSDGTGATNPFLPSGEAGTETRICLGNAGEYFVGDMSVMLIYNRVLSTAEIQQVYIDITDRYITAPVTDGLVLNLDAANPLSYPGSGTTWTDLSGNGYNGTLTGGAVFDGSTDKTIVFDGVDDRIELGDVLDMGTDSITLNAWIKCDQTFSENKSFISKSRAFGQPYRYAFAVQSSTNRIYAQFSPTGEESVNIIPVGVTSLQPDQWYMATAVFNRTGNLDLYLNGQLEVSADISAFSSTNFQSNNPYRIGSYTDSNNSSTLAEFDGKISVVQQYNRALTESEIQQNFNALRGRYGI